MLDRPSWPPDYLGLLRWRQEQLLNFRRDRKFLAGAWEFYRTRPVSFINHWLDTYDPRNLGGNVRLPFMLFPAQARMLTFIHLCLLRQGHGLVEKSRDVGATWLCVAYSVWLWLFVPGAAIGWGSRKQDNVDKIGDLDSIFEKIRTVIRLLPVEFLPRGFRDDKHMNFMKVINPENGASITGESGDDIGRGGRKSIYFKDESAHYEHPELIEASLMGNTNVQIDISSVNGPLNVFARKRESGIDWYPGQEIRRDRTNVFVFDWRDDPRKDEAWYQEKHQFWADQGLEHLFAQEVDRDYSAAVEGVIIPAVWVRSAIDAHRKLDDWGLDVGGHQAGLDVADEGGDGNAYARRKGVVLRHVEDWPGGDTGETAQRAVHLSIGFTPLHIDYDCIGVGAGVKAESNRLRREDKLPKGIRFIPWNAGTKPSDPEEHVIPGDKDSPLNEDMFANLKAQAWWSLRRRFEKTHYAITKGLEYETEELVSIDSSIPRLNSLTKELSQAVSKRTGSLKLVVDKNPPGTKSPNKADAVVICYHPQKASVAYDMNLANWVGTPGKPS